jgi:hypothetical protein
MIKYVNESGTVVMTQDEEDMKPKMVILDEEDVEEDEETEEEV